MIDEVIFLHADKCERLLKIDTVILNDMVKHSQSSQNSNLTISLQYLIKEVKDEVDLLHTDKHQSSPQVDINFLCIKVVYKVILSLLMGTIKHFQSTQSSKFAISLKYLRKEVRIGVHFLHREKDQSFYRLAFFFLMEVARQFPN